MKNGCDGEGNTGRKEGRRRIDERKRMSRRRGEKGKKERKIEQKKSIV